MTNRINRFFNLAKSSVRGINSSRELAIGATLGMLAGIIPNHSLLVVVFGLVLLLSTGNLVTGVISAFAFSWAGILLEPMAHNVGMAVLTHETIRPFMAEFVELPGVAWLRVENSVVTGSLIIGLLIAFPFYRICLFLFARYRDLLVKTLTHNPISRWIVGYPSQSPELQKANP